ncbi:MAG: SDR family oxidoreductase [Parachlamydia sp.]|nr:MAG: SDR family oxidoreductase [Parachlamydia sp.]
MEKKLDTSPKHLIVSGGSKGLGFFLTESLLKSGYHVSTFSRHTTAEMTHLSQDYASQFYFAPLDISNASELEAFCTSAIQRLGNIYGVINNAAIAVDGIFATLPEVEIEKILTINLMGALALTRHCLRNMLANKEAGRILSISSVVAQRGAKGLATYAATKAALEGMTRSLAREVGSRQITVNAIAPGYMKTDLSDSLSEMQQNSIIRRTPLGRLTEFSDIYPMIEFLLSEKGQFITGQTIVIDGGLSV